MRKPRENALSTATTGRTKEPPCELVAGQIQLRQTSHSGELQRHCSDQSILRGTDRPARGHWNFSTQIQQVLQLSQFPNVSGDQTNC
jgi:hypothetical protein